MFQWIEPSSSAQNQNILAEVMYKNWSWVSDSSVLNITHLVFMFRHTIHTVQDPSLGLVAANHMHFM